MDDYINDFVKKDNGGGQMADALRYYLTAIAPETKDSEFTWMGFRDAVNSELVAVFGNFVNRAFVLMHKLCKGKVPPFHTDIADEADRQLIAEIAATKQRVDKNIDTYKFRDALAAVIDLARKGNKYMQDKQPWIAAKDVRETGEITVEAQRSIDNCLHICLQLTANLTVFINPFLPNTALKLCRMMKVVDKMLDWENAGTLKLLSVGYSLRAPEPLFRKIEDSEVNEQVEKLKIKSDSLKMEQKPADQNNITPDSKNPQSNDAVADKTGTEQPISREIVFDDFAKIDLRTGTILTAEKVEKADKLLKLSVDMGSEIRTIVSGIALHFDAAELPGKQVVVVANLAPRKMRGIESNGMILLGEDNDGKLQFIEPAAKMSNGSVVR